MKCHRATSPNRPGSKEHPGTNKGFASTSGMTLIEVVVVLAILSAVFAGAVLSLSKQRPERGLRLSVAQLASQLRSARADAIAKNRTNAFILDAKARSYRTENISAVEQLPDGVKLTLTTARRFARNTSDARLLFFPDGSSSGGRLTFSSSRSEMTIAVDWLTGAIKVEVPAR